MDYYLTFNQPRQHYISVEIVLDTKEKEKLALQLSKWRPGRYEFADYAKNLIAIQAFNEKGNSVNLTRTGTHSWELEPEASSQVIIKYNYYALAKDAGGSYIGEDLVYLNPINFLLYEPGREATACFMKLDLPSDFQVACSLASEKNIISADSFHELADAPVLAAPSLKKISLTVEDTPFFLWFKGNIKLDEARLLRDFQRFIAAQIALWGEFPVKSYHFLFLIHDHFYYHGVEHSASTVIALGPGHRLMEPKYYNELLGVSSHELFHTWNVKALRPATMYPYGYDRENYATLHHVTEGVTTYFGDLMLLKSGVWGLGQYLKVFNQSLLKRHYSNDGHRYISLEEASFKSWVDGYKQGVPNRKVSFYTKGALVAFILDGWIREQSQNKFGLENAMRALYHNYAKAGKGYTKEDYQAAIEDLTHTSATDLFTKYISGKEPLEKALHHYANYFGLEFKEAEIEIEKSKWGFNAQWEHSGYIINQVYEDSPASMAGLEQGDTIVAISKIKPDQGGLSYLVESTNNSTMLQVHVYRDARLVEAFLHALPTYSHKEYQLSLAEKATEAQLRNRESWMAFPKRQKNE